MTTIRASCPSCGDVELTPGDLQVRVCADDNRGSYSFHCPVCQLAVAKDAEPRIVDLLASSGVRVRVWHLPAELQEHRDGPGLTHDDLLDFHQLLQQEDWFSRLQDAMAEPPRA